MTKAAARVARCLAVVSQHLDRARPGWADDAELAAIARSMSEDFTSEAPSQTPSLDAAREAAYLAYFAPRTIAAVAAALGDEDAPASVLDLGAGTGAASLALAAAGAKRLHLFERDKRALDRAVSLVRELAPDVLVRASQVDLLRKPPSTRADAVVAAFCLSELRLEPSATLALLGAVAPSASRRLVIDAGDRRRARAVQHLRAEALTQGWRVAAPCPHQDVCPALERKRDWCHARAPRHLDERFARFATWVGRDADALSLAWLDLVDARSQPASQPGPANALVIGEVRAEKGRARVSVCGPSGLRFVQVLRRHKDAWRAAKELPRGARLDVARLREGGRAPDGDTAHVSDVEALQALGSET